MHDTNVMYITKGVSSRRRPTAARYTLDITHAPYLKDCMNSQISLNNIYVLITMTATKTKQGMGQQTKNCCQINALYNTMYFKNNTRLSIVQ